MSTEIFAFDISLRLTAQYQLDLFISFPSMKDNIQKKIYIQPGDLIAAGLIALRSFIQISNILNSILTQVFYNAAITFLVTLIELY